MTQDIAGTGRNLRPGWREGIPVTSRRGVQGVALAFAGGLLVVAYYYSTTGWGTPFTGCWQPVAQPYADVLASVHVLLAIGFLVAALRHTSGPTLKDRLLLTTVLATAFVLLTTSPVYTLVNGVFQYGQSGCLVIGPPLSDVVAIVGIVVAAIPLVAAAAVALGRGLEADD